MKKTLHTFINCLHQYVDQTVVLTGWVYNLRSSGKVRFILLRDGTGICQCVLSYNENTKDLFNQFEQIHQENTIQISGKVQQWKNNFEIEVSNFKILSDSKTILYPKKNMVLIF